MAGIFCPQALVFGTVGEWATAVIAAVSAIAVFWLGLAANRIASATRSVADDQRMREARSLLLYMAADAGEVQGRAEVLIRNMSVESFRQDFVSDRAARVTVQDACKRLLAPSLVGSVSKFHVFDEDISYAASKAVGRLVHLDTVCRLAVVADPRDVPGRGATAAEIFDHSLDQILGDLKAVRDHLMVLTAAAREHLSDNDAAAEAQP